MNNQNENNHSPIILRLLNTALAGCEYPLQGTTLFIVNDDKHLSSLAGELDPAAADKTICLLVDAPVTGENAVNFEVIVDPDAATAVSLRTLHPQGSDERPLELQTRISAGTVSFALRREDQSWSAQVLTPPEAKTGSARSDQAGRKRGLLLVIMLLLLGAVAAGVMALSTRQERQIVSLSDQIKPGVVHYQIYVGQDKTKYILVNNERDAGWIRQSLVKTPAEFSVQVITVQSLVKSIGQALTSQWPDLALRRIAVDQQQLEVAISRETSSLPAAQEGSVRSFIAGLIPWEQKIALLRISDGKIEQAADKALAAVPGFVEKIRSSHRLTYRITGELDDAQLQSIKQSITAFNQVWGNSYVDFVISQKHDWLKDKSFKYGDEGYIKLKPGHWYFSNPILQE